MKTVGENKGDREDGWGGGVREGEGLAVGGAAEEAVGPPKPVVVRPQPPRDVAEDLRGTGG